jgi:hypothetical protein
MYLLIDVIEFLLQSSFRNSIEFYYTNWICMMYDVWWLCSISGAVYIFIDMFYIQWHHLAKKDLWDKVYTNEYDEGKKQPPYAIHYVFIRSITRHVSTPTESSSGV